MGCLSFYGVFGYLWPRGVRCLLTARASSAAWKARAG